MRIDGMPNVIMASPEFQAAAQSAIFQSELSRQAMSLRMHDELERSHTQVSQLHAAHEAHDAGVLDPDRDPHDEGQAHRQPTAPGRPKAKEKYKKGSLPRPFTGRIIDLSA
jgi:hypothetical protein